MSLREQLRAPGMVNLCGRGGVGKTFLAWTLADELGYTYLPHSSRLRRNEGLQSTGIVLDNCLPTRQAHRDALRILQFRDVHHAVMITRETVSDYIHYVELRLTPGDQAKVRGNLASLGLFPELDEAPNLWWLVNSYLEEVPC